MAVEGLTIAAYAACGLAFAGLAFMLRPGKATATAPRTRLRLAALATVVWAALAWWMGDREVQDATLAQLLSLSLACVWIWQLEPLARWQGQPRWMQRFLRWSGVVVVMAPGCMDAVC